MKHQNSAVQGDFVNVSQNIDSPRGLILGNKVENLSCAVTSGVFCVTTSTMPGTKVKNAHAVQKADWAATLGSYVSIKANTPFLVDISYCLTLVTRILKIYS